MSDPLNLIPNLNEIMEEYAEREEEAVQATQAETWKKEEKVESRAEVEQPTEETKKRKREAEEAGAGGREEKASDWVSELAYFAWRDKLQHRDFIGERGFSKWVSPFQEVIKKRG